MKRARVRSYRRGALLGAFAGAAFAALAACGGDDPVAAGGACSVASDCQLGLICAAANAGKSVCTSDLSKVAGQTAPDGSVAAADGAAEGGGVAEADGGAAEADGGAPPTPDSGTPDAGPVDSGAG